MEAQGKASMSSFFFLDQTLILAGLEEDASLEEDSETSAAPTQSGLVKT